MAATAALAKTRKSTSSYKRAIKNRPLLESSRNYPVAEAALAAGVSNPTIWRALDCGHLKCYRIGRRVIVSGQHLLDWLAAGGKTS